MNNFFYTLIGIFIGWFLNQVSDIFKGLIKNRRRIKSVITQLLKLNSDINNFIFSLKHTAKSYSNLSSMERGRAKFCHIMTSKTENLMEQANSIQDDLADINPLISYRIIDIIEMLDKMKQLENSITDNSEKIATNFPELYIEIWLYIETTLQIFKKELESITLKLSFKVGLFSYFRIKKHLSKTDEYKEGSFLEHLNSEGVREYLNFKNKMKEKEITRLNEKIIKEHFQSKYNLDIDS